MNEDAYEKRYRRVHEAIALNKPDRVPLVPTLGNVFALGYGVPIQDAMTDQRSVISALEKLLTDLDPDYLYNPDFFPKEALDLLRPVNINYAGKTPDFHENFTYQTLDHEYMKDDEYEDFLKDPGTYLLHKVIAEKFESLRGLSAVDLYSLCGSSVMGFGVFSVPEVRDALQTMLDAGAAIEAYGKTSAAVVSFCMEQGYPVWGPPGVASNPFDEFADNIRGLVNTAMDLQEDPELLSEAVERYTDVVIANAVRNCRMFHYDTCFIPLHIGMDEFMSSEDYEKYYWPPLKKLFLALIANGITPFAFCEGNYKTRLDILQDVPKGKVVYFFEKQDMKMAKEKLGGIACIAGNFDSNLLQYGTPETVTEETRRLLDMCAADGGYLMSNALSLDLARPELLAAWRDAVEKYGRYS